MMQGDSCNLAIRILNNAGSSVSVDDVDDVEITIGTSSKLLSRGQITFENGMWMYPISQFETMMIRPGVVPAQVRVVWKNGIVEGRNIYGIRMHESISKEVL